MWQQQLLQLRERSRGFHLITTDIAAALAQFKPINIGLLHLQLQHTSASLTLNENADPTVRDDFEAWCNHTVAEDSGYFRHIDEGADDMPAHIKSSLLGTSLLLPIRNGQLALGTWQGIYLGEHRNHGGNRHILMTLQGD
ncbi:secondary thiamine-phosphate synthase enzyme YjbQ [Shewanella fodinae]|uniref:secondary thiamine-phosphate synthase enzyme YjbQ n=1 Tax=Shewanella fodinae TaxID=552357 RepID=UPI001679C3AE|nr:secondary thiamine-phosphate synthase enzyme YjbQ [Shewanella fodinae]MCL2905472.1 secondary thiamine-phosphate synthase enzyme YjbQ [Shewanella fodinae]GGY91338.1 hypothetical protein GCM10007169_05610 [Shewanella fodinae]